MSTLTLDDLASRRLQVSITPNEGSFRFILDDRPTMDGAIIAIYRPATSLDAYRGDCELSATWEPSDALSTDPPVVSEPLKLSVGRYELMFETTDIFVKAESSGVGKGAMSMPSIMFNGKAVQYRHLVEVFLATLDGKPLLNERTFDSSYTLTFTDGWKYGAKIKAKCVSTLQSKVEVEAILTLVKQE